MLLNTYKIKGDGRIYETLAHHYHAELSEIPRGCVGKTSVALRYVEDKFNDKHLTTVQASFLNKKLNINSKRVNLAIWDTAGQEKFHALGPIYYRMSNGAILVYDITDEDTFQKVKSWVKELKKMLGSDICLAIAGNKIDLEKDRNVSIEEAEEYAKQVGAVHFHTSAKQNRNIEEMFLDLTRRMIAHADEVEQKKSSLSRVNSSRRNVVVVEDDVEQTQATKSSCCGSSSHSS
ncbi:ras-related protein Rab-21 isoform X1 [Microplitis mediator]|uniref:ras-related protein Rab-21 isoform X1 n=1 Tax=Microplitis mediator TaxID=375433 RepID=UPI002554640C|nr:ras-related protein Rab-21 isoform X1 [Microplitis mediator]